MEETLLEKGVRTLHVELKPEDYQPELDKELKKVGRSVRIPGFRPGMVPRSILLKRFGEEVLREILVKMSLEALNTSLRSENIRYIFEPLLTETNLSEADPAVARTYNFRFSVALYPEFEIRWPAAGQFPLNPEAVTDEQVNQMLERQRMEAGDIVEVEKAENDDDYVVGKFKAFVADKEEPVYESRVIFRKGTAKTEEVKALVGDLKAGDVTDIHPEALFENPENYLMGAENLRALLDDAQTSWKLAVENIRRRQPAGLTEEFFRTQSGDENITTEEDFRAFLRRELEAQAASKARLKAINALRDWLIEAHREQVDIPKNFVIRWMRSKAREQEQPKDWEAEFQSHRDDFVWELLRQRMCETLGITASEEDVRQELDYLILHRLRRMGFFNVEPDMMERLRKRFSNDESEMARVHNAVLERKLMDHFFQSGVIS